VEAQSVLERALRADPTGDYGAMSFGGRDHYRHVVEHIAKRTKRGEREVADAAVGLARAWLRANASGGGSTTAAADVPNATATAAARPSAEIQAEPRDLRRAHVGYYLIDDGRYELERAVGYTPTAGERLHRLVIRHPNAVYFGTMVVFTWLALQAIVALARPATEAGELLVVLLALLPALEVAVGTLNQLVTLLMPPRTLPKLDFRDRGIPAAHRTAVVVPTLFGSVGAVAEALEHIEVQFLANRDESLHFAILSDFTDAATESKESDAAILRAAVDGVRALNEKYDGGDQRLFYLFHRPRLWNPNQGVWMGWERKRGKLAQFNQLLRGGAKGAFGTVVGDVAALRSVRYVITLDSDTVLPPDAARMLVGTIAHPLNRPVYDARVGRVVRGYGILQPRVGVSLPSAHRSLFASIHSGHPGVDPYTTAVSDVYQDLFAEGSFTGKGIYDVDAFERATHGRFPENTLLSHDLIEGNYARAGLVTDIEVYDDYPARYLTHTRRKHRWIRGDWQLLRWLRARVPGPHGTARNRLSAISRWKIVDNLRRSTVEMAQLALLVVGWTVLPGSPLLWTAVGVGVIAFPWLFSLAVALLRPPRDKSWRAYYAAVGRDAVTSLQQLALAVTFLPHQAVVSADAILRTFYRLATRRNLLEWQTASQVERSVTGASREVWRRMWPAVAVAGVIGVLVLVAAAVGAKDVAHLVYGLDGRVAEVIVDRVPAWQYAAAALPLVLLWLAAPAIAHRLSAPAIRREQRLSVVDRAQALRYALLHWRYFDRFVTAETNWLAPDNYQDDPVPVVAPRTSPTNVGLQLMAVVSAHDLGVLTAGEVAERLELTVRTMERLRRFRGHLYNWYDTTTLQVLEPAYVSTVDSGNLAGHLLALRQACLELPDEPVFGNRVWRALDVALDVTRERLAELASSGEVAAPAEWRALEAAGDRVRAARASVVRGQTAGNSGNSGTGGTGVSATSAALADVEGALRQVESSLAAAGLVAGAEGLGDRGASALEWLAWSVDLAARWRAAVVEVGGMHDDDGESPVAAPPTIGTAGRANTWPTLRQLAEWSPRASEDVARLEALAERARDFALEMDFRFLFDETRKLFTIGYNAQSGEADASYYDLLASESRLTSFLAVAKADVPVEHWFRLGRTLTAADAGTALVSWSGSMFEYLMPLLVMQSFPFTLLDQTYRAAVKRHVSYAASRGVPWGISESAYNVRDRNLTYQYRGFGVPDLALKRGLGKELVIAPYATLLAVMVDPHAALANARTLERDAGALGPYGFREALDYTRPSLTTSGPAVVGSYFAHHVGMSLVALTNVLRRGAWQRRFHADPMVRSAELILYERIPSRLVLQDTQPGDGAEAMPAVESEQPAVREYETADTPQPRVALLGNLPYTIMVSNGGGGYSRYMPEHGGVLAVTRWRADGTRDATGQWCYVRDVTEGRAWSAAHQPMCAAGNWYRATLANDRVVFHRRDGDVETVYEIAVVPDDRAEVRRVTVVNHSDVERELELTSYGEIVLASPDADRAHPAFANLFVETEWLPQHGAVLATRRPRSANEARHWCLHVAAVVGELAGEVTCETDRARFVGRGRTVRDPVVVEQGGPLSGTTGAVLDPIFALRARVRLAPGQSARVAFTTLVAETRERALELADRYKDSYSAQRALDLAWTQTQVELRDLAITPADAALYQQLAGHLFYSHPGLRAPQRELQRNQGGQPVLWAHGLSGDWPILLATIDSTQGLPTLRQLLAAHHYWRLKGMTVDLVVLNTRPASYLQELNEELVATVLASSEAGLVDRPGGVFIRRQDVINADDLLMLRATARVHVPCEGLPLGPLLERREPVPVTAGEIIAVDGGEVPAPGSRARAAEAGRGVWGRSWGAFGSSRWSGGGGVGGTGGPPRVEVGRTWGVEQHRSGAEWTGIERRGVGTTPAEGSASVGGGGGAPPTGKLQTPAGGGVTIPSRSAGWRAGDQSLLFFNGVGGLRPDTLDYEMQIGPGVLPPAPWSNVVATPEGGFCVTESGGGFTWVGNSYFFRLTPWHNDPVSDPPVEVLYVRDEESGELWSATPSPARDAASYRVTHGAGFTRFDHEHDGVATAATLAMAESPVPAGAAPRVASATPNEATKVTTLTVTNRSGRPRRVSVTSYVEWALGVMREHTQHQVRTRFDRATGAVFAQNFFDPQFSGYVAFSWMGGAAGDHAIAYTADRREFVGRNGSLAAPAALLRTPAGASAAGGAGSGGGGASSAEQAAALGGVTGAGIDPCAALQTTLDLEPGETREIVVLLGAAIGEDAARDAVHRHAVGAGAVSRDSAARWHDRLTAVHVRTPSPAFDAMVNRWALYQALACRMWARSALYQSSGAYG
ncbi:MAG TPA: glucoamylase family protein, partial [Gemmatimonadaceae bacterium]|nr:glucoamylase family protein [Gemmatimonadaceae bacterium]